MRAVLTIWLDIMECLGNSYCQTQNEAALAALLFIVRHIHGYVVVLPGSKFLVLVWQ